MHRRHVDKHDLWRMKEDRPRPSYRPRPGKPAPKWARHPFARESDRQRGAGGAESGGKPESKGAARPRPHPRRRKRIDLPVRGRRPQAPAWVGRLDHPFEVTRDRVAELLALLDGSLDPAPFFHHLELVRTINEEVNLVSRANVDAVLLQSLWESLIPIRDTEWRRGPRALDLGTGGGFPGLTLALALPDLHVTLLDSRRAKTLSLQRIIGELRAENIAVTHDRAETHTEHVETPYDAVFVRAVGTLPEVCRWCRPLLRTGGTLLAWKGPEGGREAKALDRDSWELQYALPVLSHRFVLVLERKAAETANSEQ